MRSIYFFYLLFFISFSQIGRVRQQLKLPVGFVASHNYVFRWTRRHLISYRRVTYRGQMNGRTIGDVKLAATKYFDKMRDTLVGISREDIYNFDQIPAYFDMLR